MSPWKGSVYGSRWRGMRVTWKLDFPFCQCSVIIVSVSKKFPKDWITAVQLVWAPFLLEWKVPIWCLWVLAYISSGPVTVLFPRFELGAERELTGNFSSACSAYIHKGAWILCICLFTMLGKAVIQTQCAFLFVIIQVGDRHINIKRPEMF